METKKDEVFEVPIISSVIRDFVAANPGKRHVLCVIVEENEKQGCVFGMLHSGDPSTLLEKIVKRMKESDQLRDAITTAADVYKMIFGDEEEKNQDYSLS